MCSALETLRRHWGYDSFRPLQAEIVESALQGLDTLALMPTGGGKSITFQVPALMLPGLTLVVTPLISLMKDQVDNLKARSIPAAMLHSGLSRAESRLAIKKAELGKVKLLYLSPERLSSDGFRQQLKNFNVSMIVVDEAHCISQWGYDFRPSYLNIAILRELHPRAVVMALTASATPRVVDDICSRLEFRPGHKVYRRSFARPNISYIVRHSEDKISQLLHILRNTHGTAIVYVRSRRKTGEIAQLLQSEGIPADSYHAGLMPEEKEQRQERWKSGASRVIVATNAFGMGIDKPDVRLVVHTDLPSSLEEYYQEAGRAGRDGLPSYAVAIVSARDKATLTRRLADAFPPPDYVRMVYDRACVYIDLAIGEGFNCVFDFNFTDFCRKNSLQEAPTRSALRLLTQGSYLEYVEEVDARARVMMTVERQQLYDMDFEPNQEDVLQWILRNCAGVFADYVQISETLIAADTNLTADDVYQALLGLNRSKALSYVPRRSEPYLYFTSRRILGKYVELKPDIYEQRRKLMAERIEAVKRFAFDDSHCRANAILSYFGETPEAECATCDVCRDKRITSAPSSLPAVEERLVYVLRKHPGGVAVGQLPEILGGNREHIANAVRRLIEQNRITLNQNICKLL